jgi:hypothetical protein
MGQGASLLDIVQNPNKEEAKTNLKAFIQQEKEAGRALDFIKTDEDGKVCCSILLLLYFVIPNSCNQCSIERILNYLKFYLILFVDSFALGRNRWYGYSSFTHLLFYSIFDLYLLSQYSLV